MDVKLAVIVRLLLRGQHGIHHAVGHRVQTVHLGIKAGEGFVLAVGDLDLFLLQPLVDVVEIQDRIDAGLVARVLGLLLLGDAGA